MSARVVHKQTGIPLRDGGAWVTALCSGDANPPHGDDARELYEIRTDEGQASR